MQVCLCQRSKLFHVNSNGDCTNCNPGDYGVCRVEGRYECEPPPKDSTIVVKDADSRIVVGVNVFVGLVLDISTSL